MHTSKLRLSVSTLSLALLSLPVHAGTISQIFPGPFPGTVTGTLPDQNTALLESFTLTTASNFTATTTSYLNGGFQSNLILFNAAGNFITAGIPFGPTAGTGIVGDTRLTALNLAAGSYILAISDFQLNQSLTATNLSDGFTANYGTPPAFMDASGNTRTGAFAVALSAAAAVPEPATLWLTAAPLLAAFVIRRRKQTAS